MKILCEMFVDDFFRLSFGYIVIVGKLVPDIEYFIPNNSKADLYVEGKKIMTIHIIGEDRFSGVDEAKRQGMRAVRTNTEIPKDLSASSKAKLIIFEAETEGATS